MPIRQPPNATLIATNVGNAPDTSTRQYKPDEDFRLYFDRELTRASPYHAGNDYVQKAVDRMDRTVRLIRPYLPGSHVLDIGASPFYLLDRAIRYGAAGAQGIYFANDKHPLMGINTIYSPYGSIGIDHINIESDSLPFSDDTFDVITACEILEHLEHFPLLFATEVRRILRPGGLLCITVPNACSIGNILKLIFQRNIFMKYRSDSSGRHKHEYTLTQLKALTCFLGFTTIRYGFLPSPTSDKMWLRPLYRLIAFTPGMKHYSPVLFIMAIKGPSANTPLGALPPDLYSDDLSIEG